MIVSGLQAFTLSDYPGKIAAILFTQGCNFRCPYCHNRDLLPLESTADSIYEREVDIFLEERQSRIEGVVVTGGEPTIHSDLPEFLARIKRRGFCVKLDTNGSRPAMLKAVIDARLVDYIAMDIKAPWEKYSHLAGVEIPVEAIRESIDLIAGSAVEHEFRTTVFPPLLNRDDMRPIRELIPSGSFHRIQSFRPAIGFPSNGSLF